MSLLKRSNGRYASIATRRPLARSEDLVIEELEDELLIYDRKTQRAHCLTGPAARVWQACDGVMDAAALAASLDMSTDSVERAFDELDAAGLFEQGLEIMDGNGNGNGNGITRRSFTKRTAQVGGAAAAAPLILSIAAPTPAAAATPVAFFCNLFTTQDCGSSSGCGSVSGCCCCSSGCSGEASCKGCTSISSCLSGNQVCAGTGGGTAHNKCSASSGTHPFTKCGCCGPGFFPNKISSGSAYCSCGFGPQCPADSRGVPTSGCTTGGTTAPCTACAGCCDISSTGPTPNHGFVACGANGDTTGQNCVPCCGGRPIFPPQGTTGSSAFGCCHGNTSGTGAETCNHTPPTGYLAPTGQALCPPS